MEEGSDIEYPIYEIEPLAFIVRGLLDRTLARLQVRSLACAGITLRLALDPKGFDAREIALAAPTREASTLLQMVRLDLARRPPSAAVVGVTILTLPARVRPTQLDFLRPAGPAPESLAATLARLSALVGIENVGAPAEVDTHRPEAVAMKRFTLGPPGASPDDKRVPGLEDCPLGLRAFRPPQELEVMIGRDGPMALRGKETTAHILVAAGPYRSSGEWWSNDEWNRDYWDVHASDGAVYRLHQDRVNGRWYLDGYYD
jgi:protein ImuB